MKPSRRNKKNETGAYLALMGITFPVLFLIGMMIFELHHLTLLKTHMQSVADLSALAAIRQYAGTETVTNSGNAAVKKNAEATYDSILAIVKETVGSNGHYPYSSDTSKSYLLSRDSLEFGSFTPLPGQKPVDYKFVDFSEARMNPSMSVYQLAKASNRNINSLRVKLKADSGNVAMILHYLNVAKTIEVESIAQRCDETNVKLFGICLCGDGLKDSPKELCDSGSLNGTVCEPTLPDYKHAPPPNQNECEWCDQKCLIHTEVRQGPYCGDGIKDPKHLEECDGADKPVGETCSLDCCLGDRYWTPEGCKDHSCDEVIDPATECNATNDKNCNAATCLCLEGYELVKGICVKKQKPECNHNGVQDNGETGIDCGGGLCPPCQESCPNAVEFKTPGSFEWYAPSNIVSVTAKVWGAGGGGGSGRHKSYGEEGYSFGIGGGGGGYAEQKITLNAGDHLKIIVGYGGRTGSDSATYYKADGGESSEVRDSNNQTIIGAGGGGGGGRLLIDEVLSGFDFLNYIWTDQAVGFDGYGLQQKIGAKGAGKGAWKTHPENKNDSRGDIFNRGATGGLGYFSNDKDGTSLTGGSSAPSGFNWTYAQPSDGGNSAKGGRGGSSGRCGPDGSGENCSGGDRAENGDAPGGGGGGTVTGNGGTGGSGQIILCPDLSNLTPVTVECYTSPNPARLNEEVIWTAAVKNGKEDDYIFSWNGDRKGASAKVARTTRGYSNPGTYSSTVSIYTKANTDLVATSALCSVQVGDARGQCELLGPSYHWKRATQECVVCPTLDTYHWNAELDECQSCFPPFHWEKGSLSHESGAWSCEACPTMQTWNRTFERCECPPGQKTDSVRGCIPDCSYPKVVNASYTGCECPPGSHESGTQCITCRADQEWSGWDCRCPLFTHEEFGRCVSDRPSWGG